jgi:hypothetical protein
MRCNSYGEGTYPGDVRVEIGSVEGRRSVTYLGSSDPTSLLTTSALQIAQVSIQWTDAAGSKWVSAGGRHSRASSMKDQVWVTAARGMVRLRVCPALPVISARCREISAGPAFAFGEITLPPGGAVRVEAGAMAMTRGDVDVPWKRRREN